jgi:soluble lytic murein transglycosylase-like protein
VEALIIAIALELGVPPYFALAVALTENSSLNPAAVHGNPDGTMDLGVMQLNSSWYTGDWQDPASNIRAGCGHLKWLLAECGSDLWLAAVAYNCGLSRARDGPPDASLAYAGKVLQKWNDYQEVLYGD